ADAQAEAGAVPEEWRGRGVVGRAEDLQRGLLAQDLDAVVLDLVVLVRTGRRRRLAQRAAGEAERRRRDVLDLDVVEERPGEGDDLGQLVVYQVEEQVAAVAAVVEGRPAALARPGAAPGVLVEVGVHRVVPARVHPAEDDPPQLARGDRQLRLLGFAEEAGAVLN